MPVVFGVIEGGCVEMGCDVGLGDAGNTVKHTLAKSTGASALIIRTSSSDFIICVVCVCCMRVLHVHAHAH